jgi:hypothetical protein
MVKHSVWNIVFALSLSASAQTLQPPPFTPSTVLRAKVIALQKQEKITTDPVKRKALESQIDTAMMTERRSAYETSRAKFYDNWKNKKAKELADWKASHPGK